jgi:lipoprotein-releasing system permease protein
MVPCMYTLLYSLTWKYLYKTQSGSLRTMLIMSFTSIVISCAILLLGISIMKGFERVTHTHLRATYADLTIQSPSSTLLAFDAIKKILDQEFPTLKYKPKSTYYSLVTYNGTCKFALLAALDPHYEPETFSALYQPNVVVINGSLAQELGINTGQQINILCAITTEDSTIEQTRLSAYVGNITKTEDAPTVYCSFEYLCNYLEEYGVTQVNIYVPSYKSITQTKQELAQRFGLPIYSWSDLYPSLAAALTLEKYVVGCILSLIVILSLCTMMSVITIFLAQKLRDIALLKTMGLSTQSLQLFCYIFGLSIPISASIVGLLIGSIFGCLVDQYNLIPLPASYITSHLPVDIHFKYIINIFFFVVLLSCIIIWSASQSIRTLIPAHILKIE